MARGVGALILTVCIAIGAGEGCARKLPRNHLIGPRTPAVPSVSLQTPDGTANDAARRAQEKVNSLLRQLDRRRPTATARVPAPEGVLPSSGDLGREPPRSPVLPGPTAAASSPARHAVITITTLGSNEQASLAESAAHRLGAILVAVGLIGAILTLPRWVDKRRV